MRFRIVLVAAVLVAGCGARVTPQQVQSLGASGGATTTTVADAQAADSGPTGAGPAAATATATASGGSTTGGAAAATAGGDNGGATDVGVTADTIRIGNVSTLSGPVPGLFEGAVVGALAFAAYQNSLGGIYGRKLKIDVRDDDLDAGAYRAATSDFAQKDFAMAGSLSVMDAAGAPVVEKAGIPDVGVGLSDERRRLPTFFSPVPTPTRGYRSGQFLWYSRKFPDAVKAVGSLYGEVAASKTSHEDARHAAQQVGWKFVYERGFQATETDFTADVIRMRSSGVKMVYLVSADDKTIARLANAMAQQNFHPQVFATGPSGYDKDVLTLGGGSVEGMYVDQQTSMYAGEDAGSTPEVALMNQWVQRIKPNYTTDLYVAWSWSSMRLLTSAIQAAGPKLTRAALVDKLRAVQNFDDNGLLAPGGPGPRRAPVCYMVAQVHKGHYERVEPAKGYLCEGTFIPNT